MAIRNIMKEGEECLLKPCRQIVNFDERLHELLDDMADTLRAADGAGLAAPQVGVLRAAALVQMPDGSFLEIINPKISAFEGEQDGPEGCLSVPGVYGMVNRPQKVVVSAQDRHGQPFEIEAEDFTARAFCHEIDHLSGQLFTALVSEYLDDEDLTEE